jgi:hypothetical protein
MSAVIIADTTDIIANRRKLITALRSGKYTKIRGLYFGDTETECCAWGVAAHEFGIGKERFPLSHHIAEKLGISPYGGTFGDILHMNDDQDKPFDEIADFLEAEWSLA